jgi:hypothetical protein
VAEEDDVVAPVCVAGPVLRQLPDEARHFLGAADHDLAAKLVFRDEHLLDFHLELPRVGLRGLEQDVAAVDVGRHLLEAELLEAGLQRLHADHVVAADVDAAQQGDEGRHDEPGVLTAVRIPARTIVAMTAVSSEPPTAWDRRSRDITCPRTGALHSRTRSPGCERDASP